MRRETTAALSAGLLVVALAVHADRSPVVDASAVPRTPPDRSAPGPAPIPPEIPTVVGGDLVATPSARIFGGQPDPAVTLTAAVLAAYERAVAASPPECHLTVSLLAAIGQVESGNAAGHRLDAGNRVVPAIFGPVLDGRRFRAVPDTDAGTWDGNATWDRALGPMQLIPSTWRVVAVDLDGDGVRDPQDIDDAAGAAMVYLCAGGRDLATEAGLRSAILSYNHSQSYLRLVLAWKAAFDSADLAAGGTATLAAGMPSLLAWPVGPAPSPVSPPKPGKPAPAVAQAALTSWVAVTSASAQPAPSPAAQPAGPQPAPPSATTATPDPGAPTPVVTCPTPTDPVPTDPAPAATSPSDPAAPDPASPTPEPTPVPAPCTPATDPVPTNDPVPTPDPGPTPAPSPSSTP